MDVNQSVPRLGKRPSKNFKGKRKVNNDSLKVVYISSPMKVKTSASRFMSLVQQLTGKNSDIAQYMDMDVSYSDDKVRGFCEINWNKEVLQLKEETSHVDYQVLSSISTDDSTPTSSDGAFLGPIDNMYTSQLEEHFAGILSSNSFCHASNIDVLGSYDELL